MPSNEIPIIDFYPSDDDYKLDFDAKPKSSSYSMDMEVTQT